MKFKIALNKLSGVAGPAGWVQVHDFTPVSQNTFLLKGRLIALISMEVGSHAPFVEKQDLIIGREVLTRLHEEYFKKEGDAFKLLNEAVEKVHESFKVSVLVAVFIDSKILLAGVGKMQCWVQRSQKLARIIPSANEKAAAGILQDGDIFWLGTDSFFNKVTPDLIKSHESLIDLTKNPDSTDALVTLKIEEEKVENIAEISPKQTPYKQNSRDLPRAISPVRIAIASVIDKVLKLIPQKKIFIKEEIGAVETQKRKKTATLAGAILLLLLTVSIFLGSHQQNIQGVKAKYEPILESAQHNLDEARSLSALDSSRASSLILTAKSQIDSLIAQKIKDARIDTLSAQIDEALGTVAGLYRETPN